MKHVRDYMINSENLPEIAREMNGKKNHAMIRAFNLAQNSIPSPVRLTAGHYYMYIAGTMYEIVYFNTQQEWIAREVGNEMNALDWNPSYRELVLALRKLDV